MKVHALAKIHELGSQEEEIGKVHQENSEGFSSETTRGLTNAADSANRNPHQPGPLEKRPRLGEKDGPKFRVAIYFMDTVYTPIGMLENPTSLLTMSDGQIEKEFKKEVAPIVEDRFGKGKVEEIKLVQKLEGPGWAMVGFQIDGPGFSVEPRIFVYNPRYSFASVLMKSYEAEKLQP